MKKTEIIHIRISPEVKKTIEISAAAEERTVSNFVLNIVKKNLKEGKKMLSLEMLEEITKEEAERIVKGILDGDELKAWIQGAIDQIDVSHEGGMTEEEYRSYIKEWLNDGLERLDIKVYKLVRNAIEVKHLEDIYQGCSVLHIPQDPQVLKAFTSLDKARQELKAYKSSYKAMQAATSYYYVEEYYITDNELTEVYGFAEGLKVK